MRTTRETFWHERTPRGTKEDVCGRGIMRCMETVVRERRRFFERGDLSGIRFRSLNSWCVSMRGRTDLRILERREIFEDAPKTTRDRLVKLEASIRIGGVLRKNAAIPDALFGLRFNDDEESYFMPEIDRGEMPVERYKNAQRTYFAKKMLTYYEANRQQRHVHDLGIKNFRVLTVTTTPERVERMLGALDGISISPGSLVGSVIG
jgi:hypothetical protein